METDLSSCKTGSFCVSQERVWVLGGWVVLQACRLHAKCGFHGPCCVVLHHLTSVKSLLRLTFRSVWAPINWIRLLVHYPNNLIPSRRIHKHKTQRVGHHDTLCCSAPVSINVGSPILVVVSDGHCIIRVELVCFSAFFSLGFVPLGSLLVVRASAFPTLFGLQFWANFQLATGRKANST